MSPPTFPIDFNAIRIAMIAQVQSVTGLTCIVSEPETQDAPRPPRPYFSMKVLVAAARSADDSTQYSDTGITNRGGQRKMSVSFQVFATSHEEAYNYMTLWQSSLDLFTIQEALRTAGIAVWTIQNVADISALLNTGYEGRAQLDCTFGIASNLTEDLSYIEEVKGDGAVTKDSGNTETVPIDVSDT